MLPYVVPITLGILTAAAVVIVLVEVVPKIVEDFEKEKERLQRERLRVAIPMRSVGEGERGVTTGTAGQQDVASEVRKRELVRESGLGRKRCVLPSSQFSEHATDVDECRAITSSCPRAEDPFVAVSTRIRSTTSSAQPANSSPPTRRTTAAVGEVATSPRPQRRARGG